MPPAGSKHTLLIGIAAALLCLLVISDLSRAQGADPRSVSLRIIVVDTLAEAHKVLDRLKAGEDFGRLAKQLSTDPTAPDGGNMGALDPATLRPELRDAVRDVSPGQVTGILHFSSGYAILQVLPTAPTTIKPTGQTSPLSAAYAATGTIRYSPNVGGKGEADLAYRALPKPEGWNQDLRTMCQLRRSSLATVTDQVLKLLNPTNPAGVTGKSPLDVIQMYYALANIYAYQGEMEKAVAQWETAYQIASADLPGSMPELEEVLGIAYLHKAEMENDVYRHPGDRCLFPPKTNGSYKNTSSSEKAVAYLLKYLERHPDALDVKWLLNLSYMTMGKYSAGVPQKYVIPPSTFDSPEDVGHFIDVAPEAGINLYSMSGGLIVDDFDNDGLLDIVTSDYGQCAPMHFFHNNGDGTFTDRTQQAGLADQFGGLNLLQTDYNNDGCLDILVLRGAWEFPQRKSLLRNNCNGTFTDVTAAAGLADPATQTQTAVWVDIDNDGFLDLFVGNENGPSQLFRNKGDGTFENIAHAAGVDRIAFTKGVVAADYDNDGYVDLYVSNLDGDNYLYHNNHNGTFTEVGAQAGVQKPAQSFAAWFFDYDNDGWPDLFVTSYYVSPDETLRSYLGFPPNAETNKLYRNLGNGTFRDVTSEVGLDRVFMPMGGNFGDIDNDGFLDVYLGTGNPSYASLVPNVLLHNKEGKFFTDVTASSGTGELHKGHGVGFADLNNDGSEDLLEEVGGAVPGDSHAFRLFANPGNGNDWINLHLVGVKTNRAAIGARIKVTLENEGRKRSIYRTVGSGVSFGASPLQQHIGLGKAARNIDVDIWWPVSNNRQHLHNVPANQFLEIKESVDGYRRLERHSFTLGGTKRVAAVAPQASSATVTKLK